jgi:hypothetical protein
MPSIIPEKICIEAAIIAPLPPTCSASAGKPYVKVRRYGLGDIPPEHGE